ncbi:MAG: sigma-70 family RNA polymerase sigma factor [Clostridia bacterium]|nr:sigma-70 family RNA polymerase sigma factor [Clostridia bacterium]
MTDTEREARLTAWVDQYAQALLRICFVQLQDHALAEDALQETFIKAWKAMPKYERRPILHEKAWLTRIALNICHDVQRSRWMRSAKAAIALEDLPQASAAVMPEDRALFLDICTLPEKYREILLLYHYQRLSMRDAAKVLGLDVSTVHGRLKKAEELLRRKLTEEVDEG